MHPAAVTVLDPATRVTVPTYVVGRLIPFMAVMDPAANTLLPVIVAEVLIGFVVDHAFAPAEDTAY